MSTELECMTWDQGYGLGSWPQSFAKDCGFFHSDLPGTTGREGDGRRELGCQSGPLWVAFSHKTTTSGQILAREPMVLSGLIKEQK